MDNRPGANLSQAEKLQPESEHGCHCPAEGSASPRQGGPEPCEQTGRGHEEHAHGEPDHEHDHHGHGHRGHGHHGPHHHRGRDRNRLIGTLVLTVAMMVGEAVGGWASGSLALLSDAGHMLTDAAALLLAVLALWFAGRPADLKRTYGFFRLEILSALTNGLTLIGISGFIGYEAWQRLASPQPIKAGLMMGVAVVGLLVNLGGMFLLSRSKNMNVRAAFLHLVGDALSSVGVIAAGFVAWLTGWTLLDPIVSVAIALIIAVSAVSLVRQAVHVLLEGVPEHISLNEVFGEIKRLKGVSGVHDLHVWTISHGLHALSAHLVVGQEPTMRDCDGLLTDARSMLKARFGIDHATLQIESETFARRHEAP